jgi:phospholipase C
MRFRVLLGSTLAFALGASAIAACSSKSDTTPPQPDAGGDDAGDTRPPTPAAWDRAVTRPDDATATASRASCTFQRGAMPAETLGPGTAVDKDIPISNVVVLMMENRSFDSYFGHLNKFANRTDILSAPDTASNPDVAGGSTGSHPWTHADHQCTADTDHSWKGAHTEWNGGKNDGFYQANNTFRDPAEPAGNVDAGSLDGQRALFWYDERDIPFHYALASTFAISDHYFSSVLGPTWPNRMFLYGASSYGTTHNTFPDLTAYPYPDDGKEAVIFDELEKRHVDWNAYTDGSPGPGVILGVGLVTRYDRNPKLSIADFLSQAQGGTLPPVAIVDPKIGASEGPANDDEHPPAQIQVGQHFVWEVVNAVTHSPQWAHTALFITYDENGGIYDSVSPPSACKPDDIAPQLEGSDVGVAGDFDRYGFRVPIIVVSPYAKKAFVSHTVYDHTSITKFIEAKFKLPALGRRDANADPFTDMFDFSSPPFATPPTFPEPAIDAAETSYCTATFK